MRVCLICEGSYPYVAGGVAGWVQMLCSNLKEIEFSIFSIATSKEEMSEYKYNLPPNIKEVKTVYLAEEMFQPGKKRVKLSAKEAEILDKLILAEAEEIEWKETLELLKKYRTRMGEILMSQDFYNICLKEYKRGDKKEKFATYLWSFRSMYFPLMSILGSELPKADVYHSLSTGYAGLFGSAVSYIENKPLILSEHGIYTREREEDIIRADWVRGEYKELWISFFKKISMITYQQARVVTSLFEVNKTLQMELGCAEEKIRVIPNGVNVEQFGSLVSPNKWNHKKFNIATVLRVVPIKDVKTMILSFDLVKAKREDVRLIIMGNYDESPDYYEECLEMIRELNIKGITFLGQVDIREHLPDVDLLLLSSISEGQPLAVLEGLAAGIPFVCTNVGDCKNLLEGNEGDELGKAGYIVPVMDSDAMAEAILKCINNPKKLKEMGEIGKKRVQKYYRREQFLSQFEKLYQEVGGK